MKKYEALKKNLLRMSAVIMAIVVFCTAVQVNVITPVKAETGFHLYTADDVLELAAECTLDTWSEGTTVILENDISMKGKNFTGIPVFSGLFEGNGYTISDLSYEGKNVDVGFFGMITESGVVRNLNLEGTIDPDGVANAVGGLVSDNAGVLNNCSFKGTVDNGTYYRDINTAQTTGGIAGVNEKSGQIVNCSVSGTVKGLKSTGGLVGKNYGSIINSTNYAKVNPAVKDRKMKLSEISFSSLDDIKDLLNYRKVYASECTGGIAGESTGFIIGCINEGVVGTKGNGYNIGGIVGRTGGFVSACANNGDVYGNSNVGGIAGQMEPSVSVTYSGDLLEGVQDQVDSLFTSVDNTLSNIDNSSDAIFSNVNSMLTNIQMTAEKTAVLENTLVSYLQALSDTSGEEAAAVNQLLESVRTLSGNLKVAMDDAQKVTTNVTSGIGHVKNVTGTIADGLEDFSDDYEEGQQVIKTTIDGEIRWEYPKNEDGIAQVELPSYVVVYLLADGVVAKSQTVYPKLIEKTDAEGNTHYETQWTYSFSNVRKYSDEAQTEEIVYTVAENEMDLQSSLYHDPSEVAGAGWQVTYGYSTSYILNTKTDAYEQIPVNFTGSSQTLSGTVYWDETVESGRSDQYRPDLLYNELDASVYYYIYALLEDSETRLIGMAPFTMSNTKETEYEWNLTVTGLPDTYHYFKSDGTEAAVPVDCYYMTCSSITYYTQNVEWEEEGFRIARVVETLKDNAGETIVDKALDIATSISGDVDDTVADLQKAGSYTTVVIGDLSAALAELNTNGMPAFAALPRLPDEAKTAFNEMKDYLNSAVSSVKGISTSLQDTKNVVVDSMQDLTSSLSDTTDSIFDMLYNFSFSFSSLIVDESYASTDETESEVKTTNSDSGVIMTSVNRGSVTGKTKVGGIVGTMAITRMPSIISEEKGEGIAVPSFVYRAVVDSCESTADIAAQGDYAGMICGRQNLGAIISSRGYGNVQSVEGNYVGGISGFAHGTIANCQVQGNLAGEYYVGGLIGCGSSAKLIFPESTVQNSLAYVTIKEAQQYSGAIAGDDTGTFRENYYLSDEIQGINGRNIHNAYERQDEDTFLQSFVEMDLSSLPWHRIKTGIDWSKLLLKGILILVIALIILKIVWKIYRRIRRKIRRHRRKQKREKKETIPAVKQPIMINGERTEQVDIANMIFDVELQTGA